MFTVVESAQHQCRQATPAMWWCWVSVVMSGGCTAEVGMVEVRQQRVDKNG